MNALGKWTAILLAGQRPGENVFALSHGVSAKALIPVGGEPMLGRVARTLLAAPSIGNILILAQEPEILLHGALDWMAREPRITLSTGRDGISQSIAAIAGRPGAPWPVLIVTADHALLTPEMLEHFLARADDADVTLAAVERKVVEAAYPQTRRTWIRLSDADYTGANLFGLTSDKAHRALALWARVERDRKKSLRLLTYFGPLLALRGLTRTISLDAALRAVGRKAGLTLKAVRLPFAQAAIDVDKPADLELVEAILARR